jgi:hypothetical protein
VLIGFPETIQQLVNLRNLLFARIVALLPDPKTIPYVLGQVGSLIQGNMLSLQTRVSMGG